MRMERRGGRFSGWRCLVALGDAKMRDIYERVLAAGGADVAEWENLRADYSWALEEARRVLEVSESLRAFECWITIHIDDRIFIWL